MTPRDFWEGSIEATLAVIDDANDWFNEEGMLKMTDQEFEAFLRYKELLLDAYLEGGPQGTTVH